MDTKKSIAISLVLVILNTVSAHFNSYGLLMSPLVAVALSTLVLWGGRDLGVFSKSVVVVGLISIQDVALRFFAGGYHDLAGEAIMKLFLIAGFILGYCLTLIGLSQNEARSKMEERLAILIFPIYAFVYYHFSTYLGIEYPSRLDDDPGLISVLVIWGGMICLALILQKSLIDRANNSSAGRGSGSS